VQDWVEEVFEDEVVEEEELLRVQHEIERLHEEHESIMRRQVALQCTKARRQHKQRVSKACRAIVHHQHPSPARDEARASAQTNATSTHANPPPPLPPYNQILHQPPLPLSHLGTIVPKSPLANHLQRAPWTSHYRSTPPPKYHDNTDPHKFLMCYEATIASADGDEAILAKSLIISLEDVVANWYSRLSPKCIYS
jgi:hypothetical protein